MKAVVIHSHGGPEELVYEDIETPAIGPEDVLIKLETVGLNHFDLDVCDGISGYLKLDMPHILGVEGAGTVAQTGAAVSAFRPGDRVMPFSPSRQAFAGTGCATARSAWTTSASISRSWG